MISQYVPDRGHLVWVTLDPKVGHEQGGRRPAIVLTSKDYNGRVGLAVCCPITSRRKGYPFEVEIMDGLPVSGAILVDQIKCVDWRSRYTDEIGAAPDELIEAVFNTLDDLFERP